MFIIDCEKIHSVERNVLAHGLTRVGLMTNLTDLGFSKGAIVETIVSTYGQNKEPNAAPMGATMQNNQTITMKVFHSSQTYENLLSTKCAVVNVTSDTELFYRTAFKEANPIPEYSYIKAQTVNAPRLKSADAIIEVSVSSLTPLEGEKTEAKCNVELINTVNVSPQVYSRARFATIEAIIHATRIRVFLNGDDKQRKQASHLLELVNVCRDVVNHTAPNSRYAEIMSKLNAMIELWRKTD